MVRSNQGGSVLSFLIIGGALIVLLIGGVYFIRTRANDTAARPATDKQQTSKPAETVKPSEDKPTNTKPEGTQKEKETTKPKSATPSSPQPSQLPQTGPAETLVAVVGAGLLTGTATAYYRSRQRRVTL